MKNKFGIALLLSFLLVLSVKSSFAASCIGFPDAFYGTLKINGANAPAGTGIRGVINNVEKGYYKTTVSGQYGQAQGQNKLYVNCPESGDLINFEVNVSNNWVDSGETAICGCGDIENLDIDVNAQICQPSQEVCDGVDNDCDSQIDEGVKTTFYRDLDVDTYGNALVTQQACNAPQGYVANDDDCNDNDNTVYPGAPELADGKDNDCDGTTDEGTNAFDDDGDGFSENQGDCNDNDTSVYPGAPELEDGKDNDCDQDIDEGTPASDDDHDDFSENQGDCNDNNPNIFPGAEEACDNVDNDCNQNTADGVDEPGYGDPTVCGIGECASNGQVLCINGDMVDTCQPGPPSIETCDGEDDDCNGIVDNGALLNFFQDFDIDTYGNPIIVQQACQAPQGYVANDDDCNDNNVDIHPGAQEVCDQVDNNCNGQVDEGNVCQEECPDGDEDGVCDDVDPCEGSPNIDNDGDGICNSVDECPDDSENDDDNDNVCGNEDACPGFDDNQDADSDGFPDGCDSCPNDANNDADQDGICGDVDVCPGFDDSADVDADGIPDGCDTCPNDPFDDSDGDGVCGDVDVCPGFDDNQDADGDGFPDGCDACPSDPDNDADEDGVCGDEDQCPLDNPDDSDSDGTCDTDDLCPGFDDSIDSDEDGTPDGCDEDVEVLEASVPLFDGWTLFALPLNPAVLGIENSEELGQAIMEQTGLSCDAISTFDGATQLWIGDVLGFPDPSFGLAGAQGYFIHCDGSATYTYSGTVWT